HRIFHADPDLHVIAMLRDPRAVITSRHKSRPDVYFAGYLRWREYVDAIERLRGHSRFMVVRYEDLVGNPDSVQAQISARFPFLREKRRFSTYPESADVPESAAQSLNGVRPFDTSRIDGWREHLPRVNGQLRDHPEMPQDLVRAGYEQDDGWTRLLEGEDCYTQKYKDHGPGFFRKLESNFRFWVKTRRYLRALSN
ncbi:MAG: sulfotransferase, partial [Gammaproteobacteria bacterium]|nr:sulfotransferase [Gammaproteobacteria bacterium]